MMKKTILNRDIILDVKEKVAGKSGTLLLMQDQIGGHVVTLAGNNVGDVTIDLTPNVTTELTYRIDDEKVYWTSKVLNPVVPYMPPVAIQNLKVEYVNTNDVKIKWLAPVADYNRSQMKVSMYTLICSEAMITTTTTLADLLAMPKQVLPIKPAFSGEQEFYIIRNLIPGRRYFINVIATNLVAGKKLNSNLSNIEYFFTPYDTRLNTNVPSIIPMSPRTDKTFVYYTMPYREKPGYELDENAYPLDGRGLATQDGVANHEGAPDGKPLDYQHVTMWASGTGDSPPSYFPEKYNYLTAGWGNPYNKGWYNFDNPWIIFDLDGVWDITNIWIYVNSEEVGALGYKTSIDMRRMEFRISDDGTTWTTIAAIDVSYGVQGWTQLPVNTNLARNAKYMHLAIGSYHLGAFAVYGYRTEAHVIQGLKHRRETTERTINKRLGVNGFLGENNVDLMAGLSSITRWYNPANWFIKSPDWQERADDLKSGWNESDLLMKFHSSLSWDPVQRFTAFKNAGVENLLCINNTFGFTTSRTYIPTIEEAQEARPMDPWITDRENLLISTNPNSYRSASRFFWNLAAKYGSNPGADPQYVQIDPQEEQSLGLGLVRHMEVGNERDSIWAKKRFLNAEEAAAYHSAMYDGHKGIMGNGFGVKNADPNMQVLNAATVAPETAYLWRMMKWWDKNRGVGDYPMDIISYHHYSSWRDEPEAFASNKGWAVRPERLPESGDHSYMREVPHFRNSFMPNKEIWLTEIGYSEHFGSFLSPNYGSQIERSFYKACWLIRTVILNMYLGADVINVFWYANHDGGRLEDQSQTIENRAAFLTCGYTDGDTAFNDWNRHLLVSGWYMTAFRVEMDGYYLKHRIKEGLIQWTLENIIDHVDPTVHAFALEKDTGESALLVWLSDAQDSPVPNGDLPRGSKAQIRIFVDNSETSIEVVVFEGADIRQDRKGASTSLLTQSADGKRFVEVMVGECPVMVKTKNTGTEKLKPLDDIRIQSISASSIKLTWTDYNTGSAHKTKVFMSTSADSGFTLVNNTVVTNAEFTASNLIENTNYFFRIQLQDGDKESDMTITYGASTLNVLRIPSDFTESAKSSTTITLEWAYPVDKELEIEHFVLFRGRSLSGSFSKLGEIEKFRRSFTDTNLLPNTEYFYKIVSGRGVNQYSALSIAVITTTESAGAGSPKITSGKSNFVGDIIYVKTSRPVRNVAGNESAFIITQDGVIYPQPIQDVAIYDTGAMTLAITLNGYLDKNKLTNITYDEGLGNILDMGSDDPMETATASVTNNTDSDTLLTKRVRMNFVHGGTTDLASETTHNGEFWNDIVIPLKTVPNAQEQFQGDLKTISGSASGWRFLLPASDWPVPLSEWANDLYRAGYLHPNVPAKFINVFPAETRKSGAFMVDWRPKNGFNISGLDTSKEYNIWLCVAPIEWEEKSSGNIKAETVDGSAAITWPVSKGSGNLKLGLLRGVKANSGTFTNLKATAREYDGSGFHSAQVTVSILDNDINLILESMSPYYQLSITGIVVEELHPLVI